MTARGSVHHHSSSKINTDLIARRGVAPFCWLLFLLFNRFNVRWHHLFADSLVNLLFTYNLSIYVVYKLYTVLYLRNNIVVFTNVKRAATFILVKHLFYFG